MTTLSDLIDDYSARGAVMADAGNGAAGPANGRFVEFDAASIAAYGSVVMTEIAAPHTSADGVVCKWVSDWIIEGAGDNPYRIRFFF